MTVSCAQNAVLNQKRALARLTENVDPDYALLQRSWDKESVDGPGLQAFLETFMIQHSDGRDYLSSEKLNKFILEGFNTFFETAVQDGSIAGHLINYIKVFPAEKQPEGSSYKLKIMSDYHTLDFVLAFPCANLEFMVQWANRERKHGWPRAERIWKIMQVCAYVVPKRSKKWHHHRLEFRICHTFGEIDLMKSLNETQTKLYVLLKELFKSEFEPNHPDIITSYVLKNVVFWMCERTPSELFKFDLLLDRFAEALLYTQDSVTDGVIPNYFIPERNLLDGLITPETHREITSLLSNLVAEGDNVVLRIKNIQIGLQYVGPDIIQTVITFLYRNSVEMSDLHERTYLHGYTNAATLYFIIEIEKCLQKHNFVASPKL